MLKINTSNTEKINELKAQLELEAKKDKVIADLQGVAKKHGFESLEAMLADIVQVDAPARKKAVKDPNAPKRERKEVTKEEIEKVLTTWETLGNNAAKTAEKLGIKYPRVVNILKKHANPKKES